jgi:hypothetical protein
MADRIEIKANELARSITMVVKITGYRRWVIRLGIAMRLIQFAAWVAGVGIRIERAEDDERPQTEADSQKET